MWDYQTLDAIVEDQPEAVLAVLDEAAISNRERRDLGKACRQRICELTGIEAA